MVLFVIGISICTLVGIQVGSELSADEEIVKTHQITPNTSMLTITSPNKLLPGKGILEDKFAGISIEGEMMYQNYVGLEIEKSKTDSMLLEVIISSKGKSTKDALKSARLINYNYQITDSTLVLDNYLSTLKDSKIRGQQVRLKLYLPLNQVVYLDESVKEMLFDVDNVSNTYDKKMVGKKWVMLTKGLSCLDCEDINGITTSNLDSIQNVKPLLEEIK